ncbi:hypothetical protein HK098_005131 [Nowakowskiella sp. JEL0407]|nr:hypothetical protein HK098_005131 [Nowakowskiella sp. JEL0407]
MKNTLNINNSPHIATPVDSLSIDSSVIAEATRYSPNYTPKRTLSLKGHVPDTFILHNSATNTITTVPSKQAPPASLESFDNSLPEMLFNETGRTSPVKEVSQHYFSRRAELSKQIKPSPLRETTNTFALVSEQSTTPRTSPTKLATVHDHHDKSAMEPINNGIPVNTVEIQMKNSDMSKARISNEDLHETQKTNSSLPQEQVHKQPKIHTSLQSSKSDQSPSTFALQQSTIQRVTTDVLNEEKPLRSKRSKSAARVPDDFVIRPRVDSDEHFRANPLILQNLVVTSTAPSHIEAMEEPKTFFTRRTQSVKNVVISSLNDPPPQKSEGDQIAQVLKHVLAESGLIAKNECTAANALFIQDSRRSQSRERGREVKITQLHPPKQLQHDQDSPMLDDDSSAIYRPDDGVSVYQSPRRSNSAKDLRLTEVEADLTAIGILPVKVKRSQSTKPARRDKSVGRKESNWDDSASTMSTFSAKLMEKTSSLPRNKQTANAPAPELKRSVSGGKDAKQRRMILLSEDTNLVDLDLSKIQPSNPVWPNAGTKVNGNPKKLWALF